MKDYIVCYQCKGSEYPCIYGVYYLLEHAEKAKENILSMGVDAFIFQRVK